MRALLRDVSAKAKHWFSDVRKFRQLCDVAQSRALGARAEEFTRQMTIAADQHGLEASISESQLRWLCRIANWDVPKRIDG